MHEDKSVSHSLPFHVGDTHVPCHSVTSQRQLPGGRTPPDTLTQYAMSAASIGIRCVTKSPGMQVHC